ncbi:hypothetical protein VP01_2069g5 [Puccinia sorghi]|uniref:Uncharacterized protein n=1 Tax=Puccinia sorghi TaxID=27349 RepID=A0A0L6VAM8_9BASI|nr:hypothetical protein VP01_2069g5 [Puccinia sorghi]
MASQKVSFFCALLVSGAPYNVCRELPPGSRRDEGEGNTARRQKMERPYIRRDSNPGPKHFLDSPLLDEGCRRSARELGLRKLFDWANSLNPLASHVVKAYNQSVIADDYEMLRQGDDESAKAFYKRFSEWQLRAQHHRYKYEARSAFIDRLNNRLRSRVCTQMARYKQRAEPVNFSLLFLIVLEEDGQSD